MDTPAFVSLALQEQTANQVRIYYLEAKKVKISWMMMYRLNKKILFEELDHAPLMV